MTDEYVKKWLEEIEEINLAYEKERKRIRLKYWLMQGLIWSIPAGFFIWCLVKWEK